MGKGGVDTFLVAARGVYYSSPQIIYFPKFLFSFWAIHTREISRFAIYTQTCRLLIPLLEFASFSLPYIPESLWTDIEITSTGLMRIGNLRNWIDVLISIAIYYNSFTVSCECERVFNTGAN